MIVIKDATKFVGGHHIECSRSSKFSLTPATNSRKTELFLYQDGSWSDKKYPVDSMNVVKKSIFPELEDELSKCEEIFKPLLLKIEKQECYAIVSDEDRKMFATYVAMNLARNPSNLDAMLRRKEFDIKNKINRNILIDQVISFISQLLYYQTSNVTYFALTVKDLLVCPDTIIYSVHEKSDPHIKYHIMPLTHNKYIMCCFYDVIPITNQRINKSFTTTEINNFSFMSDCSSICGDDNTITFTPLNNFVVNIFINH